MDNNKSDTRAQQKKAREEFIKLKKMQAGEIAPEPKPSEMAVEPKTAKDKANNLWYHYKTAFLLIAALAATLAICIAQCATRPVYDISVVVYTNNYYTDDQSAVFKKYIEQFATDINADGQVNVQIINCSYSTDKNFDMEYTSALSSKLQSTMASEASVQLYITDEAKTEHLNTIAKNYESFFLEQLPVGGSLYEIAKQSGEELPEGLTIGRRRVEGMSIENDKNIEQFVEQAVEIMGKVKAR